MARISLSILLGYLLDMIFGDPQWFPHPVRIMGFFIPRLEGALRRRVKNERLAGIILAILIMVPAYLAVSGVINIAARINPYLGIAVSAFFIYTALAVKDLKNHSSKIGEELKSGNISAAREKLALIVGRDTENLSRKEIVRATVETIAENSVDGIISPLFYSFLGGPALALSYKAINTLDSMVGYRNARYKDFGWASARLDDLANFIPARLSLPFLALAGWLCGHNPGAALKIGLRDGGKNPSPNSGIPEAAVAGALGVQLGGLNFYHSQATEKPLIGDNLNPLGIGYIKESINIVYVASALFMATGVAWLWLR